MSQAVIRSMPPPRQKPWTAAITGLGDWEKQLAVRCNSLMVR